MMREIPSEFAEFVRDAGVRAFDRLSERTKEVAAPLRAVLREWSKLTQRQREELFDALIATTSAGGESEPEEKRVRKRAAKKTAKKSSKKES